MSKIHSLSRTINELQTQFNSRLQERFVLEVVAALLPTKYLLQVLSTSTRVWRFDYFIPLTFMYPNEWNRKHDPIHFLFSFQAGCHKRHQSPPQGFPKSERQEHVVSYLSSFSHFTNQLTYDPSSHYEANVRYSDDIMNYVLERVPPPRPGLPRPRFSLYLSSQLQYGVIIVYHRQCAILLGKKWLPRLEERAAECAGPWLWLCLPLEELHTIVAQLLKQRTAQKIDMDDHSRWEQVLNTYHIFLSLELQTQFLCIVPFSQTSSGPPRCPVSPGGDRRSSGPSFRCDEPAGGHAESQHTDTGIEYQN